MITYSNITDRVIDGMSDILNTEFPGSQINFDKIRPNSFLITPEEDNLIELTSFGQRREYVATITYELKIGGQDNRNGIKAISNVAERIKRLFAPDNNSSYSPSGSYKWHNGRVISVEYERGEDNPEIMRALITFACEILENN